MYCLLIWGFAGCTKEKGCKPVEPESESAQILAFAAANNITVTKHNSGIYYQIYKPGTGDDPSDKSIITVNYVGEILNGDKGILYEQYNNYSKMLSEVIEGWQIGIKLIKEGGRIKLIIPSALAYGCNGKKDANGNMSIPGNSILYFDVSLTDVK